MSVSYAEHRIGKESTDRKRYQIRNLTLLWASSIYSRAHRADQTTSAVAISYASSHPTRGNDLDWSLKRPQSQRWYPLSPLSPHTPQRSPARADLQLDGVEFSLLPSGLHLVEQDVVYASPFPTLICTRLTSLSQVLHEGRPARGMRL